MFESLEKKGITDAQIMKINNFGLVRLMKIPKLKKYFSPKVFRLNNLDKEFYVNFVLG